MSIRYLMERNFEFSPVLLPDGSKIATNFCETGNSCKVVYDPSISVTRVHSKFEVSDAKFPKFAKIPKENHIPTFSLKTHEDNQVLKRRHYFDNSNINGTGSLVKYSDKRYTANACWELKSKSHSVQELSDRFEIYKENNTTSLYKSSSRLMDRKLTLLITGKNNIRNSFLNGSRKKCPNVEYPFRSQPIGVNTSTNRLNPMAVNTMKHNYSNFRRYGTLPIKRPGDLISSAQFSSTNSNFRRYGTLSIKQPSYSISSTRFSSTICIPFINQRRCYSSINLSGSDHQKSKLTSIQLGDSVTENFGSTKSMESLFVNSQHMDIGEKEKGDFRSLHIKATSPNQDERKIDNFHENIVKIKSLLRPVDINESIRFKNMHRLKKKLNNQFDKKLNFFESIGNSSMNREEYKYCSLPGRTPAAFILGLSNISLSDA